MGRKGGSGVSSGGGGGALGRQGAPKNIDEALSTVNPHYIDGREYQINCQRCVYAYEMARRGYDVEALPRRSGNDEVANNWYRIMEGQTWQKMPSRNTESKLDEAMAGFGDGSRAVVYVAWKGGRSAHVFNAERVNGRTLYMDAQTGKRVNITRYLDAAIKGRTEISRIDNLKPSNLIEGCARRRTG